MSRPFLKKNDKTTTDDSTSLDWGKFLIFFWKKKGWIVVITAIFGVLGAIYALSLDRVYTAEVLLAPANSSVGGMDRFNSSLGGIAALTGINLDGGAVDKVSLGIKMLESRIFLYSFIEYHNIIPEILAVEEWDFDENKIIYDDELLRIYSKAKEDNDIHLKDLKWEAYNKLRNDLDITVEKMSGFITIKLANPSPINAEKWLSLLVSDLNKSLRAKDIEAAEKSITFLDKEVNNISFGDVQNVFYNLIEKQIQVMTMANISEEYVFETIDPAYVPANDDRKIIIIISTMLLLGFMAATSIIYIAFKYKKD